VITALYYFPDIAKINGQNAVFFLISGDVAVIIHTLIITKFIIGLTIRSKTNKQINK
jgi:hypothetical protein